MGRKGRGILVIYPASQPIAYSENLVKKECAACSNSALLEFPTHSKLTSKTMKINTGVV